MNWIKNNKGNIILSIISVAVTLVVADFLLHFTKYRSVITKSYYPRFYFTYDKENGFDITPNFPTTTHLFPDGAYSVWSNSMGCFDTAYNNEAPYIYLAGDSFTWGFTPFEDKWGTKIESLLGTRVLKCGVGGYGTKQELIKTTRHLEKLPSPELIIVGYTQGNDIDDDANFPGGSAFNGYLMRNLAKNGLTEVEAEVKYARFDKYCTTEVPASPFSQRIRCWFNNHSVIYNLAKNNIRQGLLSILPKSTLKDMGLVVEEKKVFVDVVSDTEYKKHLQNILDFKELAKEKNSKLLFVLVPGDNEKLKPFLEEEKIEYLDLRPIFERYSKVKPLQWKIDGHWNVAGNHLAGYEVSKFLVEKDIVTVLDKSKQIEEINRLVSSEFGTVPSEI